MKKKFVVGWVLLCVPILTHGQLWITEIQYDPAGSDTDTEWIEIFNGSDTTIDVESFRFRENNTKHGIKSEGDIQELLPGEYAVIADDTAGFRSAFPGYQGLLFDSAFSLKNTGELLELLNSEGSVVFEVSYSSSTGGSNNGYTVGLLGDVWFETYASPGAKNERHIYTVEEEVSSDDDDEVVEEDTENSESDTDTEVTPLVSTPATYIEIKNPEYTTKLIKVDAGGDRTVMSGVGYWFRGEVFGLQGGILDDPEVRWNWGDGSQGEGNPDRHLYRHAGLYTASMIAISGKYSARDMFKVKVVPPSLTLAELDTEEQSISIANDSVYTLEISGYEITHHNQSFVFPPDTFITGEGVLAVPMEVHGMQLTQLQDTVLSDSAHQEISVLRAEEVLQQALEVQVLRAQSHKREGVVESPPVTLERVRTVSPTEDNYTPTHSVVYIGEQKPDTSLVLGPAPLDVYPKQEATVISALPQNTSYWLELVILWVICFVGIAGYIMYYYHNRARKDHGYTIIE